MVDVSLPGTGGMVPLVNRWLSCCWTEHNGNAVLIDCGEGTQIALKKAGCKLSRLKILLITHFHADHISGLQGLLLSLGNTGKTSPLIILGPVGLEKVVSALMVIAPVLPFRLEINEIENTHSAGFELDEFNVYSINLEHGIPCLGYKIEISRKPKFNPEKAINLNIPKTYFSLLHSGRTVTLNDGRVIEPKMVLAGPREPVRVCYVVDTKPFDELALFAKDSDLFICEGMYGEDSMRDKMLEKGHMVFSDAAKTAKLANVEKLWLTHFSPAMQDPKLYSDGAKAIFSKTEAGYDGIRITITKR